MICWACKKPEDTPTFLVAVKETGKAFDLLGPACWALIGEAFVKVGSDEPNVDSQQNQDVRQAR